MAPLPGPPQPSSRLLGEPLVWFLAVGAVLFGLQAVLGADEANPSSPGSHVGSEHQAIDVARIRDEARRTLRERTGRAPTEAELDAETERLLREAVLAAEARRLGLGEADSQVRARLAELMRWHLEAAHPPPEPTEEALRRWFETHRERYTAPPRVRLQACRLPATPSRERAEALVARTLEMLRRGDLGGCAPLLPPLPTMAVPSTDLGRLLGSEVERLVRERAVGEWFGPVSTPSGTLLLRVAERTEGPPVPYARLRPRLRADWLRAERARRRERAIEHVMERYRAEGSVSRAEPSSP